MKTKKIGLFIAFVFCQIGLSIIAKGQSLTINCGLPNNTCSYALPNNAEHTYFVVMNSFTKCGQGASCKYKWEVTNGHILTGSFANPSVLEADAKDQIKVIWDNTNGNGTIKVTSDKPSGGLIECLQCPIGLTQTKTIPIRYLGTPGNIKINGVEYTGNYQLSCGTSPITVSVAPVTNATNYVWTYPAGWGLSGSGNVVSLTPTAGSGGVIKVTTSRSDVPNLVTTSSSLSMVRPVPTKPVINSPDILLCNPKTITASASNATSYNWVSTGGITVNSPGNTNSAQITGVSDGTVMVSASSSVCNVTSAYSIPINVKRSAPLPASLLVTANGGGSPDFMCNGAGVMLNAYTAEPGTQFGIWTSSDPGNTILNSNGGTAYFNSYVNNCYGIDITVSNCFGSVQKGITICVDNCAKGTPIYKVFPNPAKDQVRIQFDDVVKELLPQAIKLFSEVGGNEVRSVQGAEQYKSESFNLDRTITLSVSDLPRGTYYLRLINRDGSTENVRLILD